jgi:hypothetical protein
VLSALRVLLHVARSLNPDGSCGDAAPVGPRHVLMRSGSAVIRANVEVVFLEALLVVCCDHFLSSQPAIPRANLSKLYVFR